MDHLPEHSPLRSALTPSLSTPSQAGGTQALRDRDRNRAVPLPYGPRHRHCHDHLPVQHVTLAGNSQGGKIVLQRTGEGFLRLVPRATAAALGVAR